MSLFSVMILPSCVLVDFPHDSVDALVIDRRLPLAVQQGRDAPIAVGRELVGETSDTGQQLVVPLRLDRLASLRGALEV
jgi:hypothetical protein